jgi:hypothetical protein
MMGLGIWPGLIVFILLLTSRNRALAEPMDLFPDDKAPRPPTG